MIVGRRVQIAADPARRDAPRPYRAFGYPVVPALYMVVATAILVVLAVYRASTTWPGFLIVMAGVPLYVLARRTRRRQDLNIEGQNVGGNFA